MSAVPAGATYLSTALRTAESMRDELRSRVGASGLRVRMARTPLPLTIGLDDAHEQPAAALVVDIDDAEGHIANILVTDAKRLAFPPEEAATIRQVAARYAPALRECLNGLPLV